jgi:hypothetical protein
MDGAGRVTGQLAHTVRMGKARPERHGLVWQAEAMGAA